MRISVRTRAGHSGREPCSFCLGACRLQVVDILERCQVADACRFQVRVSDGRRFVIRYQPQLDRWELAAVYPPRVKPHRPPARRA
ncbi:MAG: hypothetical protein ACREUN_01515 [Burkholderiales bacterium]